MLLAELIPWVRDLSVRAWLDIGQNSSVILSRRKFHIGNECAYEITKGIGGGTGWPSRYQRTTHTSLAEGHDFSTVGSWRTRRLLGLLLILRSRYLSCESGIRMLPPPLLAHKHNTSAKPRGPGEAGPISVGSGAVIV